MAKCRLMLMIMCVVTLSVAAHEASLSKPLLRRLSTYTHVWPEMEFGWRIIAGTIIGFIGATSGSIGGIGGGGIFVPMLTLVIGFDTKSATALSKCMVMATAGATTLFNLKKRNPMNPDEPLIDYDLALLIQPSLVLGISIGVTLNVIFPQWIVTLLLIGLVLATTTKASSKGFELWNNENRLRARVEGAYQPLAQRSPRGDALPEAPLLANVHWTEVSVLVSVWLTILAIQISKNNTTTCSTTYWVLDLLQTPVAIGASSYQAVMLYRGHRRISSRGDQVGNPNWRAHELALCCVGTMLAGTAGGLLGIGGGLLLTPLLLEMGIHPQVSPATSMFAITFSSSMSIVEYYLLKRFPVPYALYFFGVAIMATLVGQLVIRKLIEMVGRESIIVFVLASTLFISAFLLGSEGVIEAIHKIQNGEYMGFESLCSS